MNPNYNKNLAAIISILIAVVFLLSYCSFNKTNNNKTYIDSDTVPACVECDEFYKGYLEDSLENDFIEHHKDSIDFKRFSDKSTI